MGTFVLLPNLKGTGLENAVQKCEWMAVKQYSTNISGDTLLDRDRFQKKRNSFSKCSAKMRMDGS